MAETAKTFPECLTDRALGRAFERLRFEQTPLAESVRREYRRRREPAAAPAYRPRVSPDRLSDAALVNAYEQMRFDRTPEANRVRATLERRCKGRRVASGRIAYAWDSREEALRRIVMSTAQVSPAPAGRAGRKPKPFTEGVA